MRGFCDPLFEIDTFRKQMVGWEPREQKKDQSEAIMDQKNINHIHRPRLEKARLDMDLASEALQSGRRLEAWEHIHRVCLELADDRDSKESKALYISASLDLSQLGFVLGKNINELTMLLTRALKSAELMGDRRSRALINLHLGRLYYFGQRRLEAHLKPVNSPSTDESQESGGGGTENKLKALFDLAVGGDLDKPQNIISDPGAESEVDEDPEKEKSNDEIPHDVEVEAPDKDNQSALSPRDTIPSEQPGALSGGGDNGAKTRLKRRANRRRREDSAKKDDADLSRVPAEIADSVYD